MYSKGKRMNHRLEILNNLLQSNHADYTLFTHELTFKSAAEGAKHFGISMSETTPKIVTLQRLSVVTPRSPLKS